MQNSCARGDLNDFHQEVVCTSGDPPVSVPDPDPTASTTFRVGYFVDYNQVKPGVGTTARTENLWAVFAESPDAEKDKCGDPTFTEPSASGSGPTISISYPLTVGLFNAAGTNCFYRKESEDARGVVTCGSKKVDCVKDTARIDSCGKGEKAWHPHDKCILTV